MGRTSTAHKGPQRNTTDGKGGGEIRQSLDIRTSGSVYLSDRERDMLKRAGGTKNLSKAIQHVTYLIGLIRRE